MTTGVAAIMAGVIILWTITVTQVVRTRVYVSLLSETLKRVEGERDRLVEREANRGDTD